VVPAGAGVEEAVILCFSIHFWNFNTKEVRLLNATGHVWFAFSTDLDDESNLSGGRLGLFLHPGLTR
jgi:hypothetical protein